MAVVAFLNKEKFTHKEFELTKKITQSLNHTLIMLRKI